LFARNPVRRESDPWTIRLKELHSLHLSFEKSLATFVIVRAERGLQSYHATACRWGFSQGLARTGDRNPRQSLVILIQFVLFTFLENIQDVVVLCPFIRPSAVSASRRARAVVQLISSFVATNLMDTGILIFSMRSTTFSSNELFPSFARFCTLNDLFNQSLYNSKMRWITKALSILQKRTFRNFTQRNLGVFCKSELENSVSIKN